jgi:hypothetical protein
MENRETSGRQAHMVAVFQGHSLVTCELEKLQFRIRVTVNFLRAIGS